MMQAISLRESSQMTTIASMLVVVTGIQPPSLALALPVPSVLPATVSLSSHVQRVLPCAEDSNRVGDTRWV